jgi:hypothetical protein
MSQLILNEYTLIPYEFERRFHKQLFKYIPWMDDELMDHFATPSFN